jgi:hypothetical protein
MDSFEIKDKIKKLLQDGKKLEAVKFARDFLKIGLVEAKELVEAAESELIASGHYNPRKGIAFNGISLLLVIFGSIGILLLSIAGFLYWRDYQHTKHSISVVGTVIKLNYESNATAPVVQYKWNGVDRIYSSNVFSSPSAFEIGETVEMLVNVNDPYEVVINQLTERYLFAIVFGFIGAIFVLIGGVGMKLNRAF